MILEHCGGKISEEELVEALGDPTEVNVERFLNVLDSKDWARRAKHYLPYVETKELDDELIDRQLVLLLDGGKQQLLKQEPSLNKE